MMSSAGGGSNNYYTQQLQNQSLQYQQQHHHSQQQQHSNPGGNSSAQQTGAAAPGYNSAMMAQNKYSQLLAYIEEIGRDVRPTYAGNKVCTDRLKKNIVNGRILVRECLMEVDRNHFAANSQPQSHTHASGGHGFR